MPATVKVKNSVLVDMVIRELLLSIFTVPGYKIKDTQFSKTVYISLVVVDSVNSVCVCSSEISPTGGTQDTIENDIR